MSSRIRSASAAPQLGGKAGVALFVAVLLAFVAESQLTQYVQTDLHYRQPFFIFYLAHSSLAIIFPLHLLYLLATTKHSTSELINGLQLAITKQLSPESDSRILGSRPFPTFRFLCLVVAFTCGITVPGLLWFASISLASVSDVTAIWNTNAFFAYIISVKVFGLRWELRKLVAVALATCGVAVVVYGGAAESDKTTKTSSSTNPMGLSKAAIGSLLTLVASFAYGLYQVMYKIYGALPHDLEIKDESDYQAIPENEDIAAQQEASSTLAKSDDGTVYPPPFGFYSNLFTSSLGVATGLLLWVIIPILDHTGIETFRLPTNWLTVFSIIGLVLSAVVFNSGLLVLIGMWGPVITSVGNLLTIVLVLISDIIFGNGIDTLTIWSIVGSAAIVIAFGVLAYDMFSRRS